MPSPLAPVTPAASPKASKSEPEIDLESLFKLEPHDDGTVTCSLPKKLPGSQYKKPETKHLAAGATLFERAKVTEIRVAGDGSFLVTVFVPAGTIPREGLLALARNYSQELYQGGFLTPQLLTESHMSETSYIARQVIKSFYFPSSDIDDFEQRGHATALTAAKRYLDGRTNDNCFWAYANYGVKADLIDFGNTDQGNVSRRHCRQGRSQIIVR